MEDDVVGVHVLAGIVICVNANVTVANDVVSDSPEFSLSEALGIAMTREYFTEVELAHET